MSQQTLANRTSADLELRQTIDERILSREHVRRVDQRPDKCALRADIVRVDAAVTVVSLAGEVDLASADAFATAVIGTVSGSPEQRIVLELNRVTFLAARGIGIIVDGYRHALQAEGELALVVDSVSPAAAALRFLPVETCPVRYPTLTAAVTIGSTS